MSLITFVYAYVILDVFVVNVETINKSENIVSGEECEPEIHKFMVKIRATFMNVELGSCGGTLLNKNWVLTAAHCCFSVAEYDIRAGVSKNPNAIIQRTQVKKTYLHPRYFFSRKDRHDIALLRLTTPINESAFVKYVKLPKTIATEYCIQGLVMGWGTTSFHDQTLPDVIRCVLVPILSSARCKLVYRLYTPDVMCSMSFRRRSPCFGDSGGPLLCDGTQIGVVSVGLGCGTVFGPIVYEKVDAYLEFINYILVNRTASQRCDVLVHCAALALLVLVVY